MIAELTEYKLSGIEKHLHYWVPPVRSGSRRFQLSKSFPDRFKVVALAAGNNVELLEKQVRQFRPSRRLRCRAPACRGKAETAVRRPKVTHPLRRRGHGPGGGRGRSRDHRFRHCRDRRARADHGGDPRREDDRAGEQGSAGDRRRTRHGRVPEPRGQAPPGGQRAQRHLPVPAGRREQGHPETDPDRIGRALPDAFRKKTSQR